jgi:hypothetical protein
MPQTWDDPNIPSKNSAFSIANKSSMCTRGNRRRLLVFVFFHLARTSPVAMMGVGRGEAGEEDEDDDEDGGAAE